RRQNKGPEFTPLLTAVGTACVGKRMPPSALPRGSRATAPDGWSWMAGAEGGTDNPVTQPTNSSYMAFATTYAGTRLWDGRSQGGVGGVANSRIRSGANAPVTWKSKWEEPATSHRRK